MNHTHAQLLRMVVVVVNVEVRFGLIQVGEELQALAVPAGAGATRSSTYLTLTLIL